jgi:hypothetical protein
MRNVAAELADNSIGTWKLNLAKSKRTPPGTNPVTSLTAVYEAVDEGVKGTFTGQLKDGTAIHFAGPLRFDGKEYPIAGAPWDTYSFTPIDAHTCTFEDKKTGGKFHVRGRQVISEDGKTMTITSEGTDADGTPVAALAVYEKQ